MLVFIDESGDSGLKLEQGSSKYFTIALVAFEDREEAIACDQRIGLLKRELGWSGNSEFHFNKNSIRVRKIFLEAVLPYDFFYYGVVIDKDPKKLYGQGFRNKKSFYKYACSLEPVFKLIAPRFSVNFCSFLHKIFRNIPDIPKNFTQKSLKISKKSRHAEFENRL
jgi:hypothetical protein